MYIKRNLSDTVRAWYGFHRARLARATEVEGLHVDSKRFTEWVLDPGNVASRPTSPDGHQKEPMRGRHVNRGVLKNLRASDLSERVYVCVKVLELKGFTNKQACLEVAEALDWKWKLGKSKRGRPSVEKAPTDFLAKAQIVRSLANKYRFPGASEPQTKSTQSQQPDPIVLSYVADFLFFEDWVESIRPLIETPEGKAAYEKILGASYVERFLLRA